MQKGKLIVMEGACDGIGKTTQFILLKKRLEHEGKKVITHHFPTYDSYQGKPVEMYLKGEFGSPEEISPFFVNSLYAVDRAITWNKELKKQYDTGSIILLDRYTTSSIIYQSSVYEHLRDRKMFMDYVCDFEYKKLGIQKPDKVIFLYMPYNYACELKKNREEAPDQNELDENLLKNAENTYLELANLYNYETINCVENNEIRTIDNISESVYKVVKNIIDF